MAYEMRPGSGSLFKNDKKTTDKHPNLKGKVMLPDGTVHWVSAWSKKTQAGEAWISFVIGEVANGGAHSQAKANAHQPPGGLDDDIPF